MTAKSRLDSNQSFKINEEYNEVRKRSNKLSRFSENDIDISHLNSKEFVGCDKARVLNEELID